MAKGYWGPPSTSCVCCSSGPKSKFICTECLHVCKAPNDGSPHCPQGHGEMIKMGQRWRPEKKSKRKLPELPRPYNWYYPKPGVQLLDKIMQKGKR